MRFQILSFSNASFCRELIGGWFLLLAVTLCAQQAKPAAPIATFTDIAEKAGLTAQNIFGGVDTQEIHY